MDFIVSDMACAIDCMTGRAILDGHLKGLRELAKDHPEAGKRRVVCLEKTSRRTADGIAILSVEDFLRSLWAGERF